MLYLPDAGNVTRGGLFYKNKATGLWDTPWAAKNVLKAFMAGHGEMLKELRCLAGGKEYGPTLHHVCEEGLGQGDPAVACGAMVGLLEELR